MKTIALIQNDPQLKPYEHTILRRLEKAEIKELDFTDYKKTLTDIANNHLYYGLHKVGRTWILREWAPNATAIYLIGDFNNWQKTPEYQLKAIENGNWEIELSSTKLHHGDLYKLLIEWEGGSGERIPAYCRRVVQDEKSKIFSAQVWSPEVYKWKNKQPKKVENPFIYEAHIGMGTEECKVGSFVEFKNNVLPHIAELGYNVLQLMAIQEHPYYGSFGYQVSNFFAVSSRFGTPEELKELIDEAHRLGIAVIMDVVHSHAVNNELEGLSKLDGTEDLYFHNGPRGQHPAWNSRCFDYGKDEVITFLLSNLKYWLDEFKFDGFRFDGVTSMMYYDHGLGRDFTNYNFYYDGNQDDDAITYLILANKLIHQTNTNALSIAEDVSGMPGLAMPFKDGGVGFDYRMSMGVADYWIKIIKEKKDENWHVGDLFYELTNKRKDEKTISYAECHDQAMVGDQTIIFRLIGEEMYTAMNVFQPNLIVERGMALHKMIRLLSASTAGNGYLTFMGNEFGHPEWIDFPREGNKWSYHYARRQWSLMSDANLRYHFLNAFDESMINLLKTEKIYQQPCFAIAQNISDQVLAFKRNELLFVFNFNPTKSFADYGILIDAGSYHIVLNSDSAVFDGQNRIDDQMEYFTQPANDKAYLHLYLPARSVIVLKRKK